MARGVSTRAWEGLPNSSAIFSATLLSFASTFAVVFLAAVLGTPLAYALSRYKFRGKRFVSLFIELPIVMPPAVAGLGPAAHLRPHPASLVHCWRIRA